MSLLGRPGRRLTPATNAAAPIRHGLREILPRIFRYAGCQRSDNAAGSERHAGASGAITVGAAAAVSATLDAGTTLGRIRNALKNTGGTPGLTIHATTTLGDITARSL